MFQISHKTGDQILTWVCVAKWFIFMFLLASMVACGAPRVEQQIGRHSLEMTEAQADSFLTGQPIVLHRYEFGQSAEFSTCDGHNNFCQDEHYVVVRGLEPVNLQGYGVQEQRYSDRSILQVDEREPGHVRVFQLDSTRMIQQSWAFTAAR